MNSVEMSTVAEYNARVRAGMLPGMKPKTPGFITTPKLPGDTRNLSIVPVAKSFLHTFDKGVFSAIMTEADYADFKRGLSRDDKEKLAKVRGDRAHGWDGTCCIMCMNYT